MLERKIRIGAVSYLNTKPFIYGLENSFIKDEIELVLDYPANIVQLLTTGAIDIGLVPVGALLGLGKYHIVSDYCIGTRGEVASVALFSQVPLNDIERVMLDYQSRSSVSLCKLLFEEYWHKKVEFIDAQEENYLDLIRDTTGGVVIGDRALSLRSRCAYVYDLGLAWKNFTGLPFVFAVWVSLKPIDHLFLERFNQANAKGVSSLETVASMHVFPAYDLKHYYTSNIDFNLDDEMKKGISTYLSMLDR